MPGPLLLPQLFHLRLSRGSLTSFDSSASFIHPGHGFVAIIEYDCTDSFGNLLSLNKHVERNKRVGNVSFLYPIVIFHPDHFLLLAFGSLWRSPSLVLISFERNKEGGSRGLDEIRWKPLRFREITKIIASSRGSVRRNTQIHAGRWEKESVVINSQRKGGTF